MADVNSDADAGRVVEVRGGDGSMLYGASPYDGYAGSGVGERPRQVLVIDEVGDYPEGAGLLSDRASILILDGARLYGPGISSEGMRLNDVAVIEGGAEVLRDGLAALPMDVDGVVLKASMAGWWGCGWAPMQPHKRTKRARLRERGRFNAWFRRAFGPC